VYDCGTASGERLVDDALIALEANVAPQKYLDLVTVSHFDRDHISGLCRLAEKLKIDTLMLPYMALEQRLCLATSQKNRKGHQRQRSSRMIFI
jgi:beta-lactamase superfamily II metal-dependent hydrolase